MIGDVRTAEKYFGEVVGKNNKNILLKRLDKVEAQKLKGDNLVKNLTDKFKDINRFALHSKELGKILDNRGMFYLLSTRPHTTSNSKFVKLVRNKVVDNRELKEYLSNPSGAMPDNIKAIRASLVRYLKLKDTEETD